MFSVYDAYLIFLLAAGWITIGIGVISLKKYWEQKQVQPAKTFAILMFIVAIWIFAVILAFVTPSQNQTYFWEQFKYIGILFVPPTWVSVAIQWSGRGRWLTTKTIVALYLISTVFIILVFTDSFHHLIWSEIRYVQMGPYLTTSVVHGFGWWTSLTYSYSLILLGSFYLVVGVTKLKSIYRKQAFILLIGSFAPWISNILYTLGMSPIPDIDFSPAVFVITGAAILYGFSHFRLIEIVPIAREAIFENIHDPIFVLDTRDRIVDFTPSTQKLFVNQNIEAIGKHVDDVFINHQELQTLLHEKKEDHGEIEIAAEGRNYCFDVKITQLLDARNCPTGRIVSLRDITEYKHAEKILRESEAMYRSIFENTGTATVIVEEDTTISLANTGFEKLSGYSRKEIEGKKSWTEFVAKEDLERMKQFHHLRRTPGENGPSNYEVHFIDRQGNIKDIYLTVGLIPGTKKSVASLLDITERNMILNELRDAHELLFTVNRDLERKVKERTAQIQRLVKQKDEFINQLGHDLKTPLTPMMILLPMLRKQAQTEKDKELFDIVIRNVHYMKELVTKTIELAKLNSDKITLKMEDINLFNEVNAIIDNNKILFEKNNITVENKIQEDLIVKADKLLLAELLNNLITNAIKYMPQDGGNITINAQREGNIVTVSVQDTGIGMTEEQIDRVFDEFYKTDPSRHDLDSSGLGLTIAKRIVEKHGGRIWAESPGKEKGTTFYFTLPAEKKDIVIPQT